MRVANHTQTSNQPRDGQGIKKGSYTSDNTMLMIYVHVLYILRCLFRDEGTVLELKNS